MARAQGSRLNLLGVVSVLLAMAALMSTRQPIVGYGPTPIALLGIGVGAIGFLISLLFGRWGSGTAALGIVLSLGAMGWRYYSDGTIPAWWAKIHSAPAGAPIAAPTPPAALPPTSPLPVRPPPAAADSHEIHNIFTDPGSSTPSDAPSPAAPRPN